MKYASMTVTRKQVRGTIWLLTYYRTFLKSDFLCCVDPESPFRDSLSRNQVSRRLPFLVNVAINRKAGIPDTEQPVHIELWRDCQLVQHLIHRNNPSGLVWRINRTRLFRTNYIRKRYGYLEKKWAEDNECA